MIQLWKVLITIKSNHIHLVLFAFSHIYTKMSQFGIYFSAKTVKNLASLCCCYILFGYTSSHYLICQIMCVLLSCKNKCFYNYVFWIISKINFFVLSDIPVGGWYSKVTSYFKSSPRDKCLESKHFNDSYLIKNNSYNS